MASRNYNFHTFKNYFDFTVTDKPVDVVTDLVQTIQIAIGLKKWYVFCTHLSYFLFPAVERVYGL